MAAPTKPGWKTTEFWMTVVSTVIMAVVASGALGDSPLVQAFAAIGMAIAPSGYSFARGKAKAAAAIAKDPT